MVKETLEVKELRVRDFPVALHDKIESYINKVGFKEKRHLNKQTATIELMEKALSKIKLD